MTILLLLVPLSLLLLLVAAWAFIWAVRKGQFDDLDTPALDVLVDEPAAKPTEPKPTAPGADAARNRRDGT